MKALLNALQHFKRRLDIGITDRYDLVCYPDSVFFDVVYLIDVHHKRPVLAGKILGRQ